MTTDDLGLTGGQAIGKAHNIEIGGEDLPLIDFSLGSLFGGMSTPHLDAEVQELDQAIEAAKENGLSEATYIGPGGP